MKNLTLLFCLLMAITTVSGQNVVQPDLTSGKYIEMPNKSRYKNKSWVAKMDNSQLAFDVDIVKKGIKNTTVDVFVDAFQLKIKKLIFNGENIASKIKESIEIIIVPNKKEYTAYYKDPVTQNVVIITIQYAENDQLIFASRLSNDPRNDRTKGTIFPSHLVMLIKK